MSKIRRTFTQLLAFFSLMLLASVSFAQLHVLVDQVGYETRASKQALIISAEQDVRLDPPQSFSLVDTATGKTVLTGPLKAAGQVDRWGGRTFWLADFSTWQTPGHYALTTQTKAGPVSSCEFSIDDDLLERNTLSNVLYYFKGQRASGDIDSADRHLPLPDGSGFVDARGGWYDATGDYG
ncbi:MAG TPA: glycoside hydrolase family 9 protein, partial [Silvibacterium sp.]|nr:glycoside hydrolase family 9 protein [Silvibacterium sp.]